MILADSVDSIPLRAKKAPGLFIVFEGVNGSGKSSLIRAVAEKLAAQNIAHTVTFEPGATPLGKELREIILAKRVGDLSVDAELLLFAADRAEHLAKVVQPALARGEVVLCDRYLYSSLAFQGYGRGISLPTIKSIMEIAVGGVYPEGHYADLVVLLDLPADEGLKRAKGREEKKNGASVGSDAFEDEALAFHNRLRDGFLKIAHERPEPFLVVDTAQPKEIVRAQFLPLIERLITNYVQR